MKSVMTVVCYGVVLSTYCGVQAAIAKHTEAKYRKYQLYDLLQGVCCIYL